MKVVVVGAELTCAKQLAERGSEVVVFEASDGVGGRIRTDEKIYRRGTVSIANVSRWYPEAKLESPAI